MERQRRNGSIGWKTLAGVLGFGTVAVVVAFGLLGSQVSSVLSTVGASIGGAYDDPGAVGGGDDSGSGVDPGSGVEPGFAGGSGSGSGAKAGSSGSGVVLAVPRDDLLVIKTGRLSMHVTDISAAVATSTDRIGALGGYASGSTRTGTGKDLRATVTFRIPSPAWDQALNAVREAGVVIDEETSTEDVTSEVVDLGARIRNLQVTERALQSIMDKAAVIKDVLTVQEQLTATRGQIEELTAQKAHLEEQAAFSTLTATFQLAPEPAVVAAQTSGFDPSHEVDAASAKLIRALQKVARAGIWFGIVWLPILLALASAALATLVIVRWVLRRWGGLQPVDMLDAGRAGSD